MCNSIFVQLIYKNCFISKAENLIFSFIDLLIACLITISYHFHFSVYGITVFYKWTAGYYVYLHRVLLYVELPFIDGMVLVPYTLLWKQQNLYKPHNFGQVYTHTDIFTVFVFYRAHTVEAARVRRHGQTNHLIVSAKTYVSLPFLFLCWDDAGGW